jgi:hypothetical protein
MVNPAAATQVDYQKLRAVVRQMESINRRLGAQQQGLKVVDPPATVQEQVVLLGERELSYNRNPDIRRDEAELSKLFRENLANLGMGQTVDKILAFTDHDLGHLGLDFSVQLPFHLKKRGLTAVEQKTVDRLTRSLAEYYYFRCYPERLTAAFARQLAHLPPRLSEVDLEQLVYLAGLSCSLRSIVEKTDLAVEQYDAAKCSDGHFTGVLMRIEAGLKITTVEPYLSAILYNLINNTFKVALWRHDETPPGAGTKVIVSARTHPQYSNVAMIEVIDNGPGFDLKTIAEQALGLITSSVDAGQLPTQVAEALRRLHGSPYANTLTLNELMRAIFLHRLSANGGGNGTMSSGLGLYGASLLANQMQLQFVVGMNHAGIPPFTTGARFMLFLPKHPYGFMPDISLLADNLSYGDNSSGYFRG